MPWGLLGLQGAVRLGPKLLQASDHSSWRLLGLGAVPSDGGPPGGRLPVPGQRGTICMLSLG